MNVIWTPDATRTFSSVDISVAVATDTGLLTPVIRGVDRMALSAVAAAGADLVGRARAGRLRQDELEGGTLSVTNLGMYGTEEFSAIINPPQSAILAVGAARQEPVVGPDGALAVASVLRVTLSADHRVIDGALAAEWMAALVRILEHPLQILV
jgi:pyruvate dehydrogenase E2 component (dihydrolipoamide acetyltransferase)